MTGAKEFHHSMATTAVAFHRFATFQALITVWCVLAVLAEAAEGRRHKECPHFSCGWLRDVHAPFRRQGDPSGCGVPSYELACTDTEATIQINTGVYHVTGINYTDFSFWVVDANILDRHSSCPLPRWDQVPYLVGQLGWDDRVELAPAEGIIWATFLNCSKQVRNNERYKPVACLSTISSYIYVSTSQDSYHTRHLEASCGYLAMIPLGNGWNKGQRAPENASYQQVVKFIRGGFAIRFPHENGLLRLRGLTDLVNIYIETFRHFPDETTKSKIFYIAFADYIFWSYILQVYVMRDRLPYVQVALSFALSIVKWIAVISRFVLAPLAAYAFLVHKYFKTRITMDAVEKFLRMQQMLGPKRYSYTDILALTGHLRDKLGQGGYGSVYKGMLLSPDVHIAIKMLGNSNCNGEEFISEVATIGRIHHVNVVRLLGFCSEERRRALVYEYMSNGSLDKYIFSSEKRFSLDKLHEIALGIARGINYLHQGCDMQILHFDIKPHNILLDDNFTPKVADFGLAKLFPRDNNFVPVSAARGTIGYIAPEMISRSFGIISSKSDVYSFGMLLLEMVGGRRNADPHAVNSSEAYYPSWVYSQVTRQEADDEISDTVNMHELEKKLCIVALWCIQMKSHDRPTMSDVIEMLEASVDSLETPPRPFFCDQEQSPMVDCYYHSSSGLTMIEEDE